MTLYTYTISIFQIFSFSYIYYISIIGLYIFRIIAFYSYTFLNHQDFIIKENNIQYYQITILKYLNHISLVLYNFSNL